MIDTDCSHTVHFPSSVHASVATDGRKPLAAILTLQNSPILFGCRTGICGTCLVLATGDLLPPAAEEQEVLAMLAPDFPNARLACQIKTTGDISLIPLTS
ncbi:MAG: 2Fe-2S iron-sulfur cluster-binding protein [Phormidesmis sp.]